MKTNITNAKSKFREIWHKSLFALSHSKSIDSIVGQWPTISQSIIERFISAGSLSESLKLEPIKHSWLYKQTSAQDWLEMLSLFAKIRTNINH